MTQWGLDTLFNPAKRHMDEEKRRLQSTREEIGDSSGGKRIDFESGKVTIRRQSSRDAAGADDEAADEAAEEAADEAADSDLAMIDGAAPEPQADGTAMQADGTATQPDGPSPEKSPEQPDQEAAAVEAELAPDESAGAARETAAERDPK
jgi:Family of unknown function (DUF6191)